MIVVGDIVHATAGIGFDFNPPILTHTAATTYVDLLGTDSFAAGHSFRGFAFVNRNKEKGYSSFWLK